MYKLKFKPPLREQARKLKQRAGLFPILLYICLKLFLVM